MLPWYATREQVKRAFDVKSTARADAQVDRALASASRDVDGDLRREFFPRQLTVTLSRPRRCTLFFGRELEFDLVAASSVVVSGAAVDPGDFDLLPPDGPPFSRLEFDRSVRFGSERRPVEIAGTWGYDDRTDPAGELAAALSDATGTTVDVSDSAAIGVGDLVTVESERMVVTGNVMLDTTQDLAGGVSASSAEVAVIVADGSTFSAGEVILVDSERMLIVDIDGNTLVVKRAWDGTVLAGHSIGADILALRRLTVERGALGSTAATHAIATPVRRQVYPGPVVAYTVAIAENRYLKEITGQGGEVAGRGVKTTLEMIRDDARRSYRRLLLG